MQSLSFMPGGSRYHLYRQASNHPRFHEMRDFEFYYHACFKHNTSYTTGEGTVFGFGGRSLGSHRVRSRREQQTVIDTSPIDGPYDSVGRDRLQQHITMTDHRSFVFLANCFVTEDQRSWTVYSLTPQLSQVAKKQIEEHALSLGFERNQFVFLSYKNCGEDPLPDLSPALGEVNEENENPDFPVGFGWGSKVETQKPDTNPIPLLGPVSNIDVPKLAGKIVTSRAIINPSAGNFHLRRQGATSATSATNRLSLASVGGIGWRR